MTSSLSTLLQEHLTPLRRHLDFTRRKQDILRLLTLPASGKTKIQRFSRSPPPVLGFGCFPAVLGIVYKENIKEFYTTGTTDTTTLKNKEWRQFRGRMRMRRVHLSMRTEGAKNSSVFV